MLLIQSNQKPVLLLGVLVIPLVSQCRYLGITISEKNCDQDINRQMRTFYSNANILLRRFSKRSIDVKCYLFKMYCSNLYCSSSWFDSSKTAMKKLRLLIIIGLDGNYHCQNTIV